MKYINFESGNNKLLCSQIVLGTHKFGGDGSPDADYNFSNELCDEIINCYISCGGNFLDTASIYGRINGSKISHSEVFIGEWIKSKKHVKEKIFISTKGGHPLSENPSKPRVTAYDIETDINASLKNLNIDTIDFYSLHRDDENVPVKVIVDVLNKYVELGSIRVIGASNWKSSRINEANKYAEKKGLAKFEFGQICYSLARTTPKAMGDSTIVCMNSNEYNNYLQNKLPVMAYNSQAWGFFYSNIGKNDNEIKGIYATKSNIEKLKRVRKLCGKRNTTPQSIVLAYLTCNKLKTFPLISADNVSQMKEMLEFVDFELTQDEIDYLDGKL